MASSGRNDSIDDELRSIVERAFPETTLEVVGEQGDDPPAFRSDDVRAAWERMHEAARGREVLVLLEMLDGNWLREEERWKAVTFLGYALHTPESASRRESILQALAVEAAVKQRGAVPNDAVRLQGGALDAIANAPIGGVAKWQSMLRAIQASRSHFREILAALAGYRPADPSAAAEAMPILLDAMMRSERLADLDQLTALVRQIDLRSAVPDVRRLLLAANSHLAARVACILADWEDAEAAPEIRRAIEQYRHASDPNVDGLLEALHRLEGAACVDYVTEVFRAAPAALQEHLLQHSLRAMPSTPVLRAVAEVGAATKDPDLKKAAEECLEHLTAAVGAAEAKATAAAAAAAAAASAAPDARRSAPDAAAPSDAAAAGSWKPTWDDTSLSTPAASTAPAASPDAEAAAGSWQPAHDDAAAMARDAPVGDSAERSRRLAIEAEALAMIRQEARQSADPSASWNPYAEAPAEVDEISPGSHLAGIALFVVLVLAAAGSLIALFATGG